MVRTLLMGTVLGAVSGLVFGVLYFGPGQITTPMAYIHDISGALLGFMIAWIVGLSKKASVAARATHKEGDAE